MQKDQEKEAQKRYRRRKAREKIFVPRKYFSLDSVIPFFLAFFFSRIKQKSYEREKNLYASFFCVSNSDRQISLKCEGTGEKMNLEQTSNQTK